MRHSAGGAWRRDPRQNLGVLRRRRARDPLAGIDIRQLQPPWRAAVEEALAARTRFGQVAGTAIQGPVRDRLDTLCARVDAGVVASWDIASRAQQSESVLATLGPEDVTAQLKAAKRRLDTCADDAERARVQAEVDALASQHAAVHSLWDTVADARDRLRLLEVRLGAAVARAATVVVAASGSAELDAAQSELASVVDELEALRGALDSLG